jgi:hypothetical protein
MVFKGFHSLSWGLVWGALVLPQQPDTIHNPCGRSQSDYCSQKYFVASFSLLITPSHLPQFNFETRNAAENALFAMIFLRINRP